MRGVYCPLRSLIFSLIEWREGRMERRGNEQVRFADDTVLVAETNEHLQYAVNEFERSCGRMGLKINARESKLLVFRKYQSESCEKVRVIR